MTNTAVRQDTNSKYKSKLVHIYTVFQKSDAKIEITITTTNLIRIKYPLSGFNYNFSGANIANFNKIHCTVMSNSCFKDVTQKQKFPIWKSRLSSSFTIPSVTVCAQSGRHLHRHLHVSWETVRSLLLPDLLSVGPVVSNCQSAGEVGSVLNKTGPCQEIPPTTLWHCNPYSALKLWSVFRRL